MSIVVHQIPKGSNNFYIYDHYRDENKIRTKYIGIANTSIVSSIPAKGYPVEGECYTEGHQAGIKAEKENFGDKKYNELDDHIKDVIPPGELAGSHTKDGKILIHKNIDKKYHEQIVTHEVTEHEYMEKKKCADNKGGRTIQSQRKIESALRHPDVLGAGSKKRKSLHLTKEEHVTAVMEEYKRGTLHTSSGKLVTTKEQALAIAYSEIKNE